MNTTNYATLLANTHAVLGTPCLEFGDVSALVGVSIDVLAMRLTRGQVLAGQPRYKSGRRVLFTGFDLAAIDAVDSLARASIPLPPTSRRVEEAVRLRMQAGLTGTTLRPDWALFVRRDPSTGEWSLIDAYEGGLSIEDVHGATLCASDARLRFRVAQFVSIFKQKSHAALAARQYQTKRAAANE